MLWAVLGFLCINMFILNTEQQGPGKPGRPGEPGGPGEPGRPGEPGDDASDGETEDERETKLDWDVFCKYQPNEYECYAGGMSRPRFYYDIKMEDCKTAKFGNCPQNMNQFNSLSECQDRCRDPGQHAIKVNLSESIYCRLQPDFGQCNDYYPLWYFDISIRSCRGFSYSGCGGNHNRFPNAQICAAVCGAVVTYL